MKATDEVFQKELAQKSHAILEVSNKIDIIRILKEMEK